MDKHAVAHDALLAYLEEQGKAKDTDLRPEHWERAAAFRTQFGELWEATEGHDGYGPGYSLDLAVEFAKYVATTQDVVRQESARLWLETWLHALVDTCFV